MYGCLHLLGQGQYLLHQKNGPLVSNGVVQLNTGASVVLNASGTGTVELGPGNAGPPYWYLDSVLLTTNRPGQSPVPRAMLYLDTISPANLQGITYDASFGQASADGLKLTRGQKLVAVWTGGQAGDIASLTVIGTRGTS